MFRGPLLQSLRDFVADHMWIAFWQFSFGLCSREIFVCAQVYEVTLLIVAGSLVVVQFEVPVIPSLSKDHLPVSLRFQGKVSTFWKLIPRQARDDDFSSFGF
jgi:hypothetical protein